MMMMSGLCLLQALSILRSVSIGAKVQLTVNKCSPSAAENVSDSEGSATPVNRSSDSVNIVAASVPGRLVLGSLVVIIIIIIKAHDY